jgi:FkbM family methyltransferase
MPVLKLKRIGFFLIKIFSKKSLESLFSFYEQTAFNPFFSVSFSQCAEDIVIEKIFNSIQGGSFLDVGAHHPVRFSLTNKLYKKGWRGINIDADPEIIKLFDQFRTEDINLTAFIGTEPKYDFSIFLEKAISSANNVNIKNNLNSGYTIDKIIQVEGVTLRKVFDKYHSIIGPDLLNIDVEGNEIDVLKSLSFETLPEVRRPKIIVIETFNSYNDVLSIDTVKLLNFYGYEVLYVLPMVTVLAKIEIISNIKH